MVSWLKHSSYSLVWIYQNHTEGKKIKGDFGRKTLELKKLHSEPKEFLGRRIRELKIGLSRSI